MPAKKKPVSTQKRTIKTKETPETKRFVIINEYDPQLARKEKSVWIIVGGLAFVLIGFWIWTFNQNQNSNSKLSSTDSGLSQALGDAANKIQTIIDQTKDSATNTVENVVASADLEQVKNNVLKQIEENLNNNLWPEYNSSTLNISLKYPTGWQISQKSDIITLSFENTSTSTSKIEISQTKKTNFKPEKSWTASEIASSTSPLNITKYIRTDSTSTIDWLLTFADKEDKNIYKVNINFNEGRGIYEPLIEKIISTINFLK